MGTAAVKQQKTPDLEEFRQFIRVTSIPFEEKDLESPNVLHSYGAFDMVKHIKCARKYGFYKNNYQTARSVCVAVDDLTDENLSQDERLGFFNATMTYLRRNSGASFYPMKSINESYYVPPKDDNITYSINEEKRKKASRWYVDQFAKKCSIDLDSTLSRNLNLYDKVMGLDRFLFCVSQPKKKEADPFCDRDVLDDYTRMCKYQSDCVDDICWVSDPHQFNEARDVFNDIVFGKIKLKSFLD
jgi:hypothetical protein